MAVDGLRSSRFVVAVLLILVLVGQVPWAMPVAAGQAAATLERAANEEPLDRPLDLASVVPAAEDLDAPGYGALPGGYKGLPFIYGRLGDPGPGSGGVSRVGASWRQTYEGWLALPSDDDPDDYARVIHTIVTRYRSDEGARAGLTATSAGYQERGYAASATAPAIGQDATALRWTGTDTRDGRVFDGLVVAFRAGPVVAEVEIRDFTRDSPAVSEATRLAGVVQRRLAEVAAGEMSDLSLAVPRARDAGTSVSNDRYFRRHGVVLQSFDQPASSVAGVDAFDRRRGVVDRYAYFADWSDPADAGAAPVGYYVTVFGFGGDAAAAERFLAAEPEDWRGRIDDAYRDVGPVEGWPGVGDEAAVVAYAVQRPSGVIARGFQGWVRVGARVTWVTSSSGAGLPRLAIDTMLRRAAACLKQPCGRTIAMADVLGLEAVSTIPDIAVAEPGDPAWAAVVPSDLTVPGYGFTGMGPRGAAAYAEAVASGEAAGALTRDLEAAGWRLGYTSGVALPNEDDPDLFDRTVRTMVSYYDSEAGASAALARLRVALEGDGHEPATSSPKVGDEAAILRKRVRAANTGNTGEVLRLLARTDAAVLDIAIVDWRDDAPATSEAV
ncbi:MAG TPA: hypothetical protein VER37_08030, partial [Thermomicrobiales bacterium]|nr:hypothetical protein [Thermomicrobiales bacterium]